MGQRAELGARVEHGHRQSGCKPRSSANFCALTVVPFSSWASGMDASQVTTEAGTDGGAPGSRPRTPARPGSSAMRSVSTYPGSTLNAKTRGPSSTARMPGHAMERALRHRVAHAPAALTGGRGRIADGHGGGDVDDHAVAPLEHRRVTSLASTNWATSWPRASLDSSMSGRRSGPCSPARCGRRCSRARRCGPTREHAVTAVAERAAIEEVDGDGQRAGSGCSTSAAVPPGCRGWLARRARRRRASPSRCVRAATATSKPAAASCTAVALPMPRLAPVTRATLGSTSASV